MSDELRVVFDNNAVISALLFEHSVPGRALYGVLDRGTVLVSHATFAELSEVLARDKFDRYISHEQRAKFLAMFLREASLVEICDEVRVCRDPKDDKFLELAMSGKAGHLVTGDRDLLVHNPFRDVSVVSPAEFLAFLSQPR
jgi:uncharacterized protein